MWARVARFEGEPADIDARLEKLRSALDAGTFQSELADAKLLMLVDRSSGGMIGSPSVSSGLADTYSAWIGSRRPISWRWGGSS